MSDSTPAKPGPAPERKTVQVPEWPKTVQTTIQPTVDIQVAEAEYTDLKRQGLLHEPENKEG